MNIKLRRLFWLSIYFLIPFFPIAAIMFVREVERVDPYYVLSMAAGVMAFVWLVNQLMLSARPRFVERYFGMDRIYRFHSLMAVVSILLAIGHMLVKILRFHILAKLGLTALILFASGIVFSLIFMEDSTLQRYKIFSLTRRWLQKNFQLKRPVVILFHNLMPVALTILLVHVLTTSGTFFYFSGLRWFYIGYFLLGIGFYFYHKFIRKAVLRKNAYRVIENSPEAANIRTLRFAPIASELFKYQPGQFVFVTILQGGIEAEAHPFSISSSPTNADYFSITVKALGDFTSRLDQVKIGSKVLVEGPYGIFSHLNHPEENELVFLAGGIGITPLLSMLRHLHATNPQRAVTLLWGTQKQSDLIAWQEISQMQQEMPNFRPIPILSNDDNWEGEKGFLNRERLKKYIGEGDLNNRRVFLCGPALMMDLCLGGLKSIGYKRSQIHYERFAL
jgi:predicted ferric reductase